MRDVKPFDPGARSYVHENHLLSQDRKIAYVVSVFPSLTMTFVDREIQEVKRRGVKVVVLAIQRPSAPEVNIGDDRKADATRYVFSLPWLDCVRANFRFALTKPRIYLSMLFYVVTGSNNNIATQVKSVLHFVEGVLAAEILKRDRVTHIHAHFADKATVVAMVAARLLGIRYSVTAHAYDIYAKPVMLREKLADAAFVTTCTAYNQSHLEREVGRQVHKVYHGLDLSTIRSRADDRTQSRPPLVLSVGSLKEKKGFPYLIKACRLLKDRGLDFTCEIIGAGPNRECLEQLISELRLENAVFLRGALPNKEVMAAYTHAAILVQASVIGEDSDRDGIPNVVLEAMATGVPVIGSNISGIPEVIQDGVTGLLVEPADENGLANAIAKLLNDPELRNELGSTGRSLVEENFNIRKNVDRLLDLFGFSMFNR